MSQVVTKKIVPAKNNVVAELPNTDIISENKYARSTPDKVRLAASLIKGKKADLAVNLLEYCELLAAKQIILPLKSAIAIAKEKDILVENLFVKNVIVEEGPKLKRRRILHKGRATAILKRMSHITVILSDNVNIKIQNNKLQINHKSKIENNKKDGGK